MNLELSKVIIGFQVQPYMYSKVKNGNRKIPFYTKSIITNCEQVGWKKEDYL